MSEKLSERRLIENELVFKRLNQMTVNGLKELKALAHAQQQDNLAPDPTEPLHFYCECSSVSCRERITISTNEYEEIHQNSRHFTIVAGHETPRIETVIGSHPGYVIVEKILEPSRVTSE